MRSKTLSSELTILKKDLTRFAPAWLGLVAYLVIWASTILSAGQYHGNYYEPVGLIFAPILALVLFGYLSDPKECNMVHSLPIRRERLFTIHTVAACLMYLLPTALFCAVTRNHGTQGAIYRFLFMGLEFLLLFSIGVLCMMLTGRKIGAALLYLFIQCLPIIVGSIVESLYLPLLPGICLNSENMLWSPSFIVGNYADFMHTSSMRPEDWAFLLRYFLISLAILTVSLVLYRRRKLEHAGDLLAVSWLDPFFAMCSGVTGASAMVIFGYEKELLILLLGCAIGYLSYWMLSKKTARVFTPKILGGLVCLIAALAGSMYLTQCDPLGRVYHVPEPESVAMVTLGRGKYDSETYTTTDPAAVADVADLHLQLAEHCVANDQSAYDAMAYTIYISYKLNNGRTIQREYECSDKDLLKQASWYLSQPIARFGYENPDFVSANVQYFGESCYLDPRLLPELTGIVLTECREGRMFDFEYRHTEWSLHFEQRNPEWHSYLNIPETAVDTIAWLKAHCLIAE